MCLCSTPVLGLRMSKEAAPWLWKSIWLVGMCMHRLNLSNMTENEMKNNTKKRNPMLLNFNFEELNTAYRFFSSGAQHGLRKGTYWCSCETTIWTILLADIVDDLTNRIHCAFLSANHIIIISWKFVIKAKCLNLRVLYYLFPMRNNWPVSSVG